MWCWFRKRQGVRTLLFTSSYQRCFRAVRHSWSTAGRLQIVCVGKHSPFAYQNAGFLAKHEERGRIVHVGQGGTENAELNVIPAIEKK
jgi:hypothetical protein